MISFHRALGALSVVTAAAAWAAGCGKDVVSPPPPPVPPPPPGPPVASDPVVGAGAVANAMSPLLEAADSEVVFVALPPGSAPDGQVATIINRRTNDSVVVPVGDGGFDPTAISAVSGDTIAIVVRDAFENVIFQPPNLVVAARRPPIVVRTNPPPKKRDVPLNSQIVIVFSEPIDAATLSASSVRLRQGSTDVAGRFEFRDSAHVTALFTPTSLLNPSTTYTLDVSQAIRDLDGEALDAAVTVEFTTATSLTYEEYFVDAVLPFSADQVGDSVVVRYTVLVLGSVAGDTTVRGIEGAVTRFRASVGASAPATTTSGLGGVIVAEWRFRGIVGVLPAQATAELTGCASNSATRCDMYWPLLLIGYNPR